MAPEGKWVAFDDDDEEEKLSLCDLPVVVLCKEKNDPNKKQEEIDPTESAASSADAMTEEFEFLTCGRGGLLSKAAEADMCAADEVFFQGQILPLRPSVSSDCGLLLASCGPSRSGSRSDSMDRCSSAVASLGFTSSRSSSISSRSSGCISRCHSSSSFSGACDAPRLSVSNNFYAHPSPSPQVRHARGRSSANAGAGVGRRSTSSLPPGWELFRLGVVKAPEIELYSLRSRRAAEGAKQRARANEGKPSTNQRDAKMENRVLRFLGRGFGCKCSPDAVGVAREGAPVATKEKVERSRSERGERNRHGGGRIFEWLEDLSL